MLFISFLMFLIGLSYGITLQPCGSAELTPDIFSALYQVSLSGSAAIWLLYQKSNLIAFGVGVRRRSAPLSEAISPCENYEAEVPYAVPLPHLYTLLRRVYRFSALLSRVCYHNFKASFVQNAESSIYRCLMSVTPRGETRINHTILGNLCAICTKDRLGYPCLPLVYSSLTSITGFLLLVNSLFNIPRHDSPRTSPSVLPIIGESQGRKRCKPCIYAGLRVLYVDTASCPPALVSSLFSSQCDPSDTRFPYSFYLFYLFIILL